MSFWSISFIELFDKKSGVLCGTDNFRSLNSSLIVFLIFMFKHGLQFQSVKKACWKWVDASFSNIYLEKCLIYEGKISQQSLYISKFWTITFLRKSKMTEQKAHADLILNDPNVNTPTSTCWWPMCYAMGLHKPLCDIFVATSVFNKQSDKNTFLMSCYKSQTLKELYNLQY